MAVTENTYTGNGTLRLYSFTFPYLEDTDIKVTLNQVATTNFELANATQINFTADSSGATATQEASGAPKTSVAVRIYRDTNIDNLQSEFFSGSAIRAQDLNNDFNQTLYTAQELVRDVGNIWDDTTETINSSETWLDSDVHIATCAAIEDKINALMSGGVFSAADPTKVALDGSNRMTGTNALGLPAGTNAQRPTGSSTPAVVNGMFRYNTDSNSFEGYAGGAWGAVGGGATGPGTDAIFWENDQTVSDDYTITNNKNAGSFGPIAVAAGKTVTVGAGEVWTVV